MRNSFIKKHVHAKRWSSTFGGLSRKGLLFLNKITMIAMKVNISSSHVQQMGRVYMVISLQPSLSIAYVWIIILIRWAPACLCIVHVLHESFFSWRSSKDVVLVEVAMGEFVCNVIPHFLITNLKYDWLSVWMLRFYIFKTQFHITVSFNSVLRSQFASALLPRLFHINNMLMFFCLALSARSRRQREW